MKVCLLSCRPVSQRGAEVAYGPDVQARVPLCFRCQRGSAPEPLPRLAAVDNVGNLASVLFFVCGAVLAVDFSNLLILRQTLSPRAALARRCLLAGKAD